jgi:drug/metabolite transporter (DMT)-like permease
MNIPSVWQPYVLLALANLFWAGNWVVGRALRDSFEPVTINFWRWTLTAAILLPIAWPRLKGKAAAIRRHLPLLLLLSASAFALFQTMIYAGLRQTTAVNAVMLTASTPLFVMACAWLVDRERASVRQMLGMLVSFAGIVVILGRGDIGLLLRMEFHAGDAIILCGIPFFAIYSVLLKRVPAELRGIVQLFVMSAMAVPMMGVALAVAPQGPASAAPVSGAALLGLAYTAVFASVLAIACFNRAVAQVGPNVAGLSTSLMPAFGAMLAVIFLGEQLGAYHVAGIATILSGVTLATRPAQPAGGPAMRAGPAGRTTPAT